MRTSRTHQLLTYDVRLPDEAQADYGSLVTTVLWIGFFVLVFTAASWGLWVFGLAVAGIYVLDILLLIFSAATWRREEVMAKL